MEQSYAILLKQAIKEVLEEIGFTNLTYTPVSPISFKDKKNEVVVLVGIVGGWKGHILLIMPETMGASFTTYLNAHLQMETPSGVDPVSYQRHAIAEVANQIAGRLAGLESINGIEVLITPPTLIAGNGIDPVLPHISEEWGYQIQGEFGYFYCILGIKNP
ncbi:MAG TPA: chemotaxis protein CheX [Termitinemataceae bacterium]|uniref:chemotaxis protein CheX n=1 Tax=Treponema sp. J25 TaxID=2094121 RepID=UPI00104ABE1F|nr:chemotaxis protein CheX [Treponema sp. J25]HOJ98716.1 chemotaxis protein CheX [Termitinemataceae bacterium]HOM23461.1 chemotaxis protein CheX [Termitinemataceae bacterium]HPQ00570.1 chemotaxis protein CheX [Termitinemataceae bacterium]